VVDPVRVVHFGSCRTGCRTGPKEHPGRGVRLHVRVAGEVPLGRDVGGLDSMTPDRPGGARLGRQRYFELTSRRKLPISNAPEDFRHGPVCLRRYPHVRVARQSSAVSPYHVQGEPLRILSLASPEQPRCSQS